MKICTIVGARPQFIKAAAVSRAIRKHNRKTNSSHSIITEVIIHTGQHYDRGMSDVFFKEMQIPRPACSLDIHGLSHGAMTGRMLEKIEAALLNENPDMVMVYGDTNSTLAGALAASKLHIPVAHVEAGLRSFNRRMPEETNRILTDHIATILFCPTRKAVELLAREGVASGDNNRETSRASTLEPAAHLVGDVMFDAVLHYKKKSKKPDFPLPKHFILATIHRAENTDNPDRLTSITRAFEEIGRETPVVIPLHPRTRKMMRARFPLSDLKLGVMDPVGYLEMLYLLEKCEMVMTDSGGVQKEACFFKKPCVTIRDETEWVELVEHGFNRIAGCETESVRDAYHEMKAKKIDFSVNLYGDGDAAGKIVSILNEGAWGWP